MKEEDSRINDTKDLYNLVCRTLTDFENTNEVTADEMYDVLVKVQNYMCNYGLDL